MLGIEVGHGAYPAFPLSSDPSLILFGDAGAATVPASLIFSEKYTVCLVLLKEIIQKLFHE